MSQSSIFDTKFNINNIANSGALKLKRRACDTHTSVYFHLQKSEDSPRFYNVRNVMMNTTKSHIVSIFQNEGSRTFKPMSVANIINFAENPINDSIVIGGLIITEELFPSYRPDIHQALMMTLNIDTLPIYLFYNIKQIKEDVLEDLKTSKVLLTSSGIPVCDIQECIDFGDTNNSIYSMHTERIYNQLLTFIYSNRANGGIRNFGAPPVLSLLNTGDAKVTPETHCVLFEERDGYNSNNKVKVNDDFDDYSSLKTQRRSDRNERFDRMIDVDDSDFQTVDVSQFTCTRSFSQLKTSKMITVKSGSRDVDSEMLDDLEKISNITEDNSFYYLGQYTKSNGEVITTDSDMVYKTNVNVGVGNLTYVVGRELHKNNLPIYTLMQFCVNPKENEGVLKLMMASPEMARPHVLNYSVKISLKQTATLKIYFSNSYKKITAVVSTINDELIDIANDSVVISHEYNEDFQNLFVVGLPVYTENSMHQVTYPYNTTFWSLAKKMGRKIVSDARNILIGNYDPKRIGDEISPSTTKASFNKITTNTNKIEVVGSKLCRLEGIDYHAKMLVNNGYDFDIVCVDTYGTYLFELSSTNGNITLTQFGERIENKDIDLKLKSELKWVRFERTSNSFEVFITSDNAQTVMNHVDGSQTKLSCVKKAPSLFGKDRSRNANHLIIDDVENEKITYPPMSFLDNYANDLHVGSVKLSSNNKGLETVDMYIRFHDNIHSSNKEILYGALIIHDDATTQHNAILTADSEKWIMSAKFDHTGESTFVLPTAVTSGRSSKCSITSLSCKPVIS